MRAQNWGLRSRGWVRATWKYREKLDKDRKSEISVLRKPSAEVSCEGSGSRVSAYGFRVSTCGFGCALEHAVCAIAKWAVNPTLYTLNPKSVQARSHGVIERWRAAQIGSCVHQCVHQVFIGSSVHQSGMKDGHTSRTAYSTADCASP